MPPAFRPQTTNLYRNEKINFCWLIHPECGILSWQPKWTNTEIEMEITYTKVGEGITKQTDIFDLTKI